MKSRLRKLLCASLAPATLLLALAACGNSQGTGGATGASSSQSHSGSSTASSPTINVGTAAALTNFADIYAAKAKGYFKDAGVNVNIHTGVGANGLNEVVSGQLDLLMFGTGQALIPASRGIDTKIVYNQIGAGEDAVIAVKAGSPYKTPVDLSGKRVSVLGVGGSSYGWGQYFSAYSKNHGGSAYNIIQSSSVSVQVDGLLSGHFDAVVSTAALLTQQIQNHQVRLLVDPTTPAGSKYIPAQYVETCTFGVSDNLEAKKEAVARFIAGMQAADKWLHSASPSEIAKTLKKDPEFNGQSLSSLEAGAKFDKHFYAPSLGAISSSLWRATLRQLAYWGLPGIDLSDPTYSYGARVDMSYLNAAEKHKIGD